MGCQRSIAAKIVEKGGDYLLAVKGNQPTLLMTVETAFIDRSESSPSYEHIEKSHGRIVVQISHTEPAKGVVDAEHWPKCKTIGRVDSFRVVGGKPSELEQRYYISSRELTAEELASAVRAHWAIENRLHWMLDVNFGEDGSQVRKDNAPQNLSSSLQNSFSAPQSASWDGCDNRIWFFEGHQSQQCLQQPPEIQAQ